MISVILPTYNSAAIIGDSIESILNQSFRDFELLVLDDGSTDNTESVISKWQDARIHYIKLQHGGLSAALNVGLQQARHDIVARMDAGDISLPLRFEKQNRFLLSHDLNTIVACRYAVFKNKNVQYVSNSYSKLNKNNRKRLALHPDFAHSGIMFYKKFITDNGSYKNIALEDYELWLRLKDGANFVILDEILLLVENANEGLSSKNPVKRYTDHYAIQEPYYKDLQREFGIETKEEETEYRGWREYFYGDKRVARKHWSKLGIKIMKYPRIMLAWLVTFLPARLFIGFKESRVKLRMYFLLHYYTHEMKIVRKEFKKLSLLSKS